MLKQTVEKALNEQINLEFQSAYLYLSMAAYFEHEGLAGFAHWMKVQALEERGHALRLFGYVNDRGGRVVLGGIDAPPGTFASPLKVFEQVLEHERKVTAAVHKLYELAVKENDPPTQTHLHWLIDEQVEEEKTAEDILRQLKAIQGHEPLLYMLDAKLAQRTSES